jgi:hypothetical protein
VSGIFSGKPEASLFTASGYDWIISYIGGDGNDITLSIASPLQSWRFTHFGSIANNDLTDPNDDGENNLLEYATAQNPLTNSRSLTTIAKNGNVLDFTYTKNKSATDINYTVEWSDDLTNWSNAGVSEQTMNDNGAVQTVRASVAAGSKQRFIRLKVAY